MMFSIGKFLICFDFLPSSSKNLEMQSSGKTLLDLPDRAIEHIISSLELKDRLNFGMSCSEINKILNNRSKFWENVWLKAEKVTDSLLVPSWSSSHTTKRNYVKVSWDLSNDEFCKDKKDENDFTPLTTIIQKIGNVKTLELISNSSQANPRESALIVIAVILFGESLASLTVTSGYHRRIFQPITTMTRAPAPAANLKKLDLSNLEYLNIPLYFFARQPDVHFSTDKLRGIVIHSTVLDVFTPQTMQDIKRSVLELIKRQENLVTLKFSLNAGFLFDQSLMLNAKLKSFDCCIPQEWFHPEDPPSSVKFNATQQNNLVDFLESQTSLQHISFKFKGNTTQKMLNHRMKRVFQRSQAARITIVEDSPNDEFIGDDIFTMEEICQLKHQEANNEITSLTITTEIGGDFDDLPEDPTQWITGLAVKFPKLKDLKVISNEDFNEIHLIRLHEFQQLDRLHLTSSNFDMCLDDVTLPTITRFEYTVASEERSMFSSDLNELEWFLERHKHLKELKLVLRTSSDQNTRDECVMPERFGTIMLSATEFQRACVELIKFAAENLKELIHQWKLLDFSI